MAAEAEEIYAARGKKVIHFDQRKGKADGAELKKVLLGPTGNLRAPAMRIGKVLVIGFDDVTYRELLM